MPSNLYQTLEDKSNDNYVRENGPFCCERGDAWLGKGYYYGTLSLTMLIFGAEKSTRTIIKITLYAYQWLN